MKKLLSALSGLLFLTAVSAQTIPDGTDFLKGSLDNGLTYYVCHNELPAGCADFYIVHNVGALQEEDNQDGLAHFLEHMAFNGTRHFPEKGILDFLAKEGVRFGYNVNAYTTKTETVYHLSEVPLVRESFVDSVLLVLHDWSCDISCEQKALDEERGVISEEWRLRDDSRTRMAQKQTALFYNGSKHTKRSVIGSLEVINGFKREEILDFYHKWYRPDLQAVIVVGDFDAGEMAERIKKAFSDIPATVNPAPKGVYNPPAITEPRFVDMTDHEIRYQAYKAFYRQDLPDADRRDEAFYKDHLCRLIVNSVMADRLRERSKEKDSPTQRATMVTNFHSPSMYVSQATVVPTKKGDFLSCQRFTEREIRRLLLYGVSPEEIEVAKLGIAAKLHLDNSTDRDELKNGEIVTMALQNFLTGTPLVLPIVMTDIRRALLDSIGPEDIAPYPEKMFGVESRIYSNSYNIKEEDLAPTVEQMKQVNAEVAAEKIEPCFLDYPDLDMSVDAAPGKVRSVSKARGSDMELWKLGNGASVYYRPAAPVGRGDHMVMTILFDTGYNALDKDAIAASRYALSYDKRIAGFRGRSKPELRNYPDMYGVKMSLGGNSRRARIDVSSTEDKVENAFKAVYLSLSDPCFGSEKMLRHSKASSLKSLGNEDTPKELFEKECREKTYGNHPWLAEIDTAAVEALDASLAEEVFRRLYGNIPSMKVILCSDLPKERMKELVEKYIASLDVPYNYKKASCKPPVPLVKGGLEIRRSEKPVSEPYSDISWTHYFKAKGSLKEKATSDILDYIMSARYLALIREERGGAYSVSFHTDISHEKGIPSNAFVEFRTRPEVRDLVLGDLGDVLSKMSAEGPESAEMDLAVKYLVKRFYENEDKAARSLSRMEGRMVSFVDEGIPYGYDYEKVVRSVKASDVRALAKKISAGDLLLKIYNEE